MMKRRLRSFTILMVLAAVFANGCSARSPTAREYPPPGRLIDIGGRKLHLYCTGKGSPTVILMAGGGAFSLDWALVGRFPASLIYTLIYAICAASPSSAVPPTFMPLPSRNTSAGRPVVLDTALLPCSFLPAKETRSDCLCPDGCAPRGNVRYIAVTLAAATILQTGSAATDILL